MKILVVNSSGRTNGNTERLLNVLEKQLLKIADKQQITLDIIHMRLAKEDIQICIGCRDCLDKGNCILKDDVSKIQKLVLSCDTLILASPVYLEDVNGIMKNWLDRMAFNSHRPAFYGKCAIAISTSGSGSSNHSLNTLKNAMTAFGFHVLPVNKFRMGAYMKTDDIEMQYHSKLLHIATNLIFSIQNGRSQKPSLFSLVSFNIQQKYYRFSDRAGTLDRGYWQEKSWLEPKVHFYIPTKCNALKLLSARVLGVLIAKIFI
ncbi:MAG: flavodoxin family protein [Lachnotalea sp.]